MQKIEEEMGNSKNSVTKLSNIIFKLAKIKDMQSKEAIKLLEQYEKQYEKLQKKWKI
jgi:hypothetical protein